LGIDSSLSANYQVHIGSNSLVRAESPLNLRGFLSHRDSYARAMSRRPEGTSEGIGVDGVGDTLKC